jgi:hypothetical protein
VIKTKLFNEKESKRMKQKTIFMKNLLRKTNRTRLGSVFSVFFIMAFLLVSAQSWGQIALRGTATTNASTSASVTVNKPTGVVAGDIMIANVGNYRDATQSTAACSDWTLIAGTNVDRGRATLLYKIATASEPDNYTFTVTSSSSAAAGAIVAFSGVDNSNPFDVSLPSSWYTETATTISAIPAITTQTANTAVLIFGNCSRITTNANANFTSWTATSPSSASLNELYDLGSNPGNSNNVALGCVWALKQSTGTTGNAGFQCTPNTNPRRMGGFMLALKVAPGSTIRTTFTSNGTFTVPNCVTSLTVEAWGGGGGGFDGGSNGGGKGGGGGGYAKGTITSASGDYTIVVGSGGAENSDGAASTFGSTLVVANGGKGGTNETSGGGTGGTATTSGVSDVTISSGGDGGNGANGSSNNDQGGGGGGAAGPNGNGASGSNASGTLGGNGGNGNNSSGGAGGTNSSGNNGNNGSSDNAGGGGGGGGDENRRGGNGGFPGGGGGGGETDGGSGANGLVNVTYTLPNNPTITLTNTTATACFSASAQNVSLAFTGPTGCPDKYSIDFASGLIDVTDADLSGSSITIALPASLAAGTYTGTLSVKNNTYNFVSQAYTVTVTVNPPTPVQPGAITGTATQCPSLTAQTYSIAAVTNATTYNWTVPTGWTITAGAGTTSITVTTGSTGQNGNISVTAQNSCGTSTARTLSVTVSANKTVGAASSSPTLRINTALTNITHTTTGATGISNAGVSGANGLPAGVSASWASNTITISGTPTAEGVFNYSIPLTGGCNSVSATGTITVVTYKSQFISANLGSTTWCAGETREVSVTIKNVGSATWADGAIGSQDINIGVKWNTNGGNWTDYHVRTDAGGLAPGETGTFTFTLTAANNTGSAYTTNLAAGTNKITFDVVYEGISWFGNNNGGVGPGNIVFTSADQTISSLSTTQTFNANGTFTVPAGVTQLTVQAWGGGGAGGGTSNAASGAANGAGGGGGGAYATKVINVTPGQTLNIQVGAGGTGASAGNGGNGGNSTITQFSTEILAEGGKGGTRNIATSGTAVVNGGSAGLDAASIGDTKTSGSNGGNGSSGLGVGSGVGGAAASPNGGTGGGLLTGSGVQGNGNAGVAPGGGGGGSRTSQSGGSFTGGAGGAGRIIISYSFGITNNSATTVLACGGSPISVTAFGGTTYSWSGGSSTNTASNTFATAGTYNVNVSNGTSCSAQSITITGNSTIPEVPSISAQSLCSEVTHTVSSLISAPQGATYTWYGEQFAANPYPAASSLNLGSSYYVSQTVNGCTSARVPVSTISVSDSYSSRGSGPWDDASTWERYCYAGNSYSVTPVNSTAPEAADTGNIIIKSGHTIAIGDDRSIAAKLAINSGGELRILSNGSLTTPSNVTNNGTFRIKAGGQFVQGANSVLTSAANAVAVFEKAIPGVPNPSPNAVGFNRGFYIGSTVDNGISPDVPVFITDVLGANTTGVKLYSYNETNGQFPMLYSAGQMSGQASSFAKGKGYLLTSSTESAAFNNVNAKLDFTGKRFNNGDVTVQITNNANGGNGFNLVSNPYPSGIIWSEVFGDLSNNSLVGSSYWLRTFDAAPNSTAGMIYRTANASGVTIPADMQVIAPGTAFWVKSLSSTSTLKFTNAMRTKTTATYYTANTNRVIRLNLGNSSYTDETVVYMNENADLGIETFDSEKLIPGPTVHQFYSLEGSTKIAINGFNNAIAKDTVLLGMQIPTAGTYSINANQIDATVGEEIFLEDKITGAYQNLKLNPIYSFTSVAGTFHTRFVLHFAPAPPVLPGQSAATAIALPTSNWPQCNNMTTEATWHSFTATSEGVSIAVNTSSTDVVIALHDEFGNVISEENAVNAIGNETLNYFGLTAGQTYKVAVRNSVSTLPVGTYGVCVKSLKRGGCDFGAGPYSLCNYYKATWAGSSSVNYKFTFTATSGAAAGQTFTRTQNSNICVLSTITPALPYGSTYDVVISNIYNLTDGAGNTEQLEVPSANGCQVVTVAEPQTTLSASNTCNNGERFRSAVVTSMPWVCGAKNWRWKFTEVNPVTMQTVGSPIEVNRGSATNHINLGSVTQLQNGKMYAVETAPIFTYTGTNYNYGPVQYMCIVKTPITANVTAESGAAESNTKTLVEDKTNTMVFVSEGNLVNIQLTNATSNTANRADIYDVTGKCVKSVRIVEGMNQVTLTESEGIYMVRTTVGNKSETTRVFVKN